MSLFTDSLNLTSNFFCKKAVCSWISKVSRFTRLIGKLIKPVEIKKFSLQIITSSYYGDSLFAWTAYMHAPSLLLSWNVSITNPRYSTIHTVLQVLPKSQWSESVKETQTHSFIFFWSLCIIRL